MGNIFEIILVLIFGAIFGSYATLFAYRLPRGESCFGRYFGRKSRCPKCDFTLMTRDLIPLLNWIITSGKCRSCKSEIPKIHLFVELASTILFLFCYLNFGFSEIFIIKCLIAVAMVIIMACDFSHKKFTNQALIFLLFFVTINRVLLDQTYVYIVYSLLLGIVISTIFYKIVCTKFDYLFINSDQIFDCIKFILIASVALDCKSLLFYFLESILILIFIRIIKMNGKKNVISIGYSFVLPLLWMLIIQPII